MSDKLTSKQKKFIAAYNGNGVEAARIAGYKGNDKTLSVVASENLAKPYIAEAIQKRENKQIEKIATPRERLQKFWTEIMEDSAKGLSARLHASELLGKSEAVFVHRVKHSGVVKLESLVAGDDDESEGND